MKLKMCSLRSRRSCKLILEVQFYTYRPNTGITLYFSDKEDWWLCTDRFTIADIDLAILLERLNQLGLDSRFWTGGKRPLVEKYYSKVKLRESFKKTIPTLLVHVQLFFITYKKPVIISVSVVAAVAVIVGGVLLATKLSNAP